MGIFEPPFDPEEVTYRRDTYTLLQAEYRRDSALRTSVLNSYFPDEKTYERLASDPDFERHAAQITRLLNALLTNLAELHALAVAVDDLFEHNKDLRSHIKAAAESVKEDPGLLVQDLEKRKDELANRERP